MSDSYIGINLAFAEEVNGIMIVEDVNNYTQELSIEDFNKSYVSAFHMGFEHALAVLKRPELGVLVRRAGWPELAGRLKIDEGVFKRLNSMSGKWESYKLTPLDLLSNDWYTS